MTLKSINYRKQKMAIEISKAMDKLAEEMRKEKKNES
jgi:hypothetical protein